MQLNKKNRTLYVFVKCKLCAFIYFPYTRIL